MEDRAYQIRALNGCRAAFGRGARRVLLVSPTGSGKTTMASQVVKGAVAKGRRVLWLAHRDELIAQAHERISQEGILCGYIKAGRPSAPTLPVQVASVGTLSSRGVPDGPWGLVVVDEAHHTRATTYEEIIRSIGDTTPILGLTATPWRADGLGLGDAYQESILAATPAELIASGHLVGYDGFTFETPDGKGVLGDIAAKYIEHASGRRAVAFAINVAHSKAIVAEFVVAGVRAEHLDGTTASEERKGILARLASGETLVVSNVGVLTEGWDCPLAEVAIVARSIGKRATSLWLQMVGRVMRPAKGKTRARIHDHGGNIAVHGLPDEERDYSLTADVTKRKRKDAVISQRNCRKCFATWTPPPVACPRCGWCLPAEEIELLSEADGRVVTIENVKLRAWMQMEAQRVRRNYKPLWSQLEFRKKHGHFPPAEWLGAGVQRALGL